VSGGGGGSGDLKSSKYKNWNFKRWEGTGGDG